MPLFRLHKNDFSFPSPSFAEPDGLLAVGGDLSPARLLEAYRLGIFPWYSEKDPLLWWSPDPRLVLFPARFHLTRRLARTMRSQKFAMSVDSVFAEVIATCANIRRRGECGTWITPEMQEAYIILHELGYAHSLECWLNGKLVGGLYGFCLDQVFFVESMFSVVSDASKLALAMLGVPLAMVFMLNKESPKTNIIRKIGGWDTSIIWDDYPMFVKLLRNENIKFMFNPNIETVLYRHHGVNSYKNIEKQFMMVKQALEKLAPMDLKNKAIGNALGYYSLKALSQGNLKVFGKMILNNRVFKIYFYMCIKIAKIVIGFIKR